MFNYRHLSFLRLIFLSACAGMEDQSAESTRVETASDALNYVGHPSQERNDFTPEADKLIFFFADQGASMAFLR